MLLEYVYPLCVSYKLIDIFLINSQMELEKIVHTFVINCEQTNKFMIKFTKNGHFKQILTSFAKQTKGQLIKSIIKILKRESLF